MSEPVQSQLEARVQETAGRLQRLWEETGKQLADADAALKAEASAHPDSFRVLELREASEQALEATADAAFALYLLHDLGQEAHAEGLEQAAREKLSLSRSWLAREPEAKADGPEIEAGG